MMLEMGGSNMPYFIGTGQYTREAMTGMMKSPENRRLSAEKLFERLGGKLHSYFVTFGEKDWLIVVEMPSVEAMAAASAIATAGGGVCNLSTTLAMTAEEAQKAFELAGKEAAVFKSAGMKG
jgi:uncharacterized protein with GYD domain